MMSENIIRLPAGVVPFDETYILYTDGDAVGVVCCVLALMPILILQSYLTWLIIDRDIEAVVVAMGQLANEALNQVLKRVFKHERPGSELIAAGNGSKTLSFGMPSAHSQFMGFFVSYLMVNLWTRWGHKYGILYRDKVVYSLAGMLLALAVCVSRWYLSYHHWDQIIIGYQVGALVGLWYHLAVLFALHPLLQWVSGHPWAAALLDHLHITL